MWPTPLSFGRWNGALASLPCPPGPWSSETPPVKEEQALYHTVVRGDTLWELARQYGVALNQIVELNPSIRNPNLIYPGQKVRLK